MIGLEICVNSELKQTIGVATGAVMASVIWNSLTPLKEHASDLCPPALLHDFGRDGNRPACMFRLAADHAQVR